MARIIKEEWEEHIKRCRHCGKHIAFTVDDVVLSTYTRGLDFEEKDGEEQGWLDADCLWHYIKCPNCGKYICVTDAIDMEEDEYLERKNNCVC